VQTDCVRAAAKQWAPHAQNLRADRLHLQYGPIDLLIDVDAPSGAIAHAHAVAQQAFNGVLEALVNELPLLREPVHIHAPPSGSVAKRMWSACLPHNSQFVTPMAAVAGAVADHILSAIVQSVPGLKRVWVNNGGDIALWLDTLETTSIAVCAADGVRAATVTLQSSDPVQGVATSGWRRRRCCGNLNC